MPDPVIAVLGPTAAGKSDLALRLAGDLGGKMINADSMQLYRGMDIGTAKLTVAQRQGIPHHLLDVWDVRYPEGRWPNISGWRGRAIAEVASPRPDPDPGRRVRAVLARRPGRPELPRHRPRRTGAARGRNWPFEARLSCTRGWPLSTPVRPQASCPATAAGSSARWRSSSCPGSRSPRRCHAMSRCTRRYRSGCGSAAAELDRRIAVRVAQMWGARPGRRGAGLEQAGLREGRTASQALGYAQVLRVLAGEWDEDEAREQTVKATRRFAAARSRGSAATPG